MYSSIILRIEPDLHLPELGLPSIEPLIKYLNLPDFWVLLR